MKKQYPPASYIRLILVGTIVLLVVIIVILSCVPPVSRDALTHHLAVPRLYLRHGGIQELPDVLFSYYPMNLDMLYLIPLYFGNDIIPKFIHFAFALLTAYFIFNYLKYRLDTMYALAGVLFFLSIPVIVRLSITIYVDLALIFSSTASLLYLFKWIENHFSHRYLAISGIFCGLALGTKYNGLLVCFLLTLFVIFISSKLSQGSSAEQFRAVRHGIIFLSVALVIFSPWMIRNYMWTHNPIFPILNSFFNTVTTDTDQSPRLGHFIIRNINYHESWWEIALIPIRIFFQGEDGNPKYFDGKLNPLLFFLPFFAFFREKNNAVAIEKIILLAFSILFLLIAFLTTDMRVRYVALILPPLVILSIFGLHQILVWCNKKPFFGSTRILTGMVLGIIVMGVYPNAAYIRDEFEYVLPLAYITGKVSRDEYIQKYYREYPVLRFANKHLPTDAKIFSLFLGNRSYYSDRDMYFDETLLLRAVKKADSAETIHEELTRNHITHMLIRYGLFNKWVHDNFDDTEKKKTWYVF